MANRFQNDLRERLSAKLCGATYAGMEKVPEADLLSIPIRDAEGFRPWLTALATFLQIPIKSIVVLIAMLSLNWEIALLLLPLLPLVMLPSIFLSRKLYIMQADEKQTMSGANGFLQSALDFMLIIKTYCLEALFLRKTDRTLNGVERTRRRRHLREQVIAAFGRCVGHIINPLVFIFGGYLILQGKMTIGSIVTIMLLINLIGEALNLIYALPTAYQEAKASMGRIKIILDMPDKEAQHIDTALDEAGIEYTASDAIPFETTKDKAYITASRQAERYQVLVG